MASTSSSPQSSLGQLGKALLKFLKPILTAKAHSKEVNLAPLPALTSDKDTSYQAPANTTEVNDAAAAISNPAKPGAEGSGIISVKRDPSTPWVNVVIGLLESCGKSSGQARSHMGTNAYQAATNSNGALAKGTIGRMVDLRTIISEEQDDDSDQETNKENPQEAKNPESSEKKKAS